MSNVKTHSNLQEGYLIRNSSHDQTIRNSDLLVGNTTCRFKKKNELPYIILKPNKLRISGEEFKILSYHEYRKLLITCSC